MGNLITKLLLPVLFSSFFAFNSLTAKAQDFLPGKFRNYQNKSRTILYEDFDTVFYFNPSPRMIISYNVYYDLDDDTICDVVEIFMTKNNKETGNREICAQPYIYLLNLGNCKTKNFLDPYLDGFNGNEERYFLGDEKKIQEI